VFEVVVVTRLFVKHVDDHVAVVERDPLGTVPAFDVYGLEREALVDEPLDFFGDLADLSIVATRGHDERVKGIDE
jgi:hypothetical protein